MKNFENDLLIKAVKTVNKKSRAEAVFLALLCGTVSVGFAFMVTESFGFLEEIIPVIVAAAVSILGILLMQTKYGRYFPPAVFVLGTAALIVFFNNMKNGALVLANGFLDFLTEKNGKTYLDIATEDRADPTMVLTVFFAFLSVLLSMAVWEKKTYLLVSIAALSTAGLLIGFLSTGYYFAVFAVGMTAALIYILLPEVSFKFNAKSFTAILCGCAAFAALAIALAGISGFSGEGKIADALKKGWHTAFYDSKTNSMPEGDLKNLGAWEKNDYAALEITMSRPQKLYLRGFVGEVYDSSGWQEIPKQSLAEYTEEFYWLHEEDFFSQSQIVTALSAVGNAENEFMTVKNISACKKTTFLPYAFESSELLDKAVIGDAETDAFDLEYEMMYSYGGLAEWYLAQVKLSEIQGNSAEADEYLSKERVYREFVYANYLDIPEDVFDAINYYFAEEDDGLSFTEITNLVISTLGENIDYSERTVTQNGDTDFIDYFLTKNTKGYSVHYASTAAMMFRYFGIPARYVEGYFLSAADAKEYESGETIVLTENNAHAWMEYYLDGVGWIPFEVTPGYIDDELEKAAFKVSGENDKIYNEEHKPQTNVIQENEKDKINNYNPDYSFVWIIVLAAFVMLLIAFLIYVYVGRKRLKDALKRIDEAENKEAVPMRFGYAVKLLHNANIPQEDLEKIGYADAFEINREALFSEHIISSEQRKIVDGFAEKVLEECKKQWNLLQKIKNRWIKSIYIK